MPGTNIALLLLGGCSTDGWCTRFNLDCRTPLPEIAASVDADGDIWRAGDDCDDTDPTVNPGATETWYDGIDQDCRGDSDWDADSDGFDAAWRPDGTGRDCDDERADVNPGATENWYDDIDDDCDGNLHDADGDREEGSQAGGPDCDDDDPGVHTGAAEIWYDGIDQDCDPSTEYDADGDGHDSIDHGGTDCDDGLWFVSLSGGELCNGRDDDCDGSIDEDDICETSGWVRAIVGVDRRNPTALPPPAIGAATDADADGSPELLLSTSPTTAGDVWVLSLGDALEAFSTDAMARVQGTEPLQRLGLSPVGGQDLNADSHPDVVFGGGMPRPGDSVNRGAVWGFLGPVSGALGPEDADITWVGSDEIDMLGRRVQGHGDLDGDAVSDLLVFCYQSLAFDPVRRETALLLLSGDDQGTLDASEAASAAISLEVDGDRSWDDWDIRPDLTASGDIDGDGLADLLIGLPYQGDAGGMAVHFGPLSGARRIPDRTLTVDDAQQRRAGWAIAVPGDLDGDGHADIMMGVPDAGESGNGAIGLLPTDAILAEDPNERLGTIEGGPAEALGTNLSAAGDLDGDG
ncbi:MAG: putative metal-binding motif-containing protein, partial [Myxococcota bacterium]|nr:putative metal-binding motif-containing protein [Myxococcota bacterium]